MGAVEIVLIVACVLIVAGVIARQIIRKKSGKSGCSGCSSNCGGCPMSNQDQNNTNKQK